MVVKVNGESRQMPGEEAPLVDLLSAVGIDPNQSGIAVALNMEVVPRSMWGETAVRDGDELELITARQGG